VSKAAGVKAKALKTIRKPAKHFLRSEGSTGVEFPPGGICASAWRKQETEIMSDIWPTELRVSKDRHRLTVTFNDGASFDLSAEMLRVLSPSAEVQGHGPGQGLTVPGKRNVSIISMTPTGNYAVRIGFDDLHDTGIFTWTYLRELGENGETLFAAYERDLAEKGMTRDKAEKPR
jgi:DUF971 family protein